MKLFTLILVFILVSGCSNIIIPPVEPVEDGVIEINDDNWNKEVIQSDFVIVDFYAIGCSPCEKLEPIIEELAINNPDIKVCKLNIWNNDIYLDYEIIGTPTLIFFKEGKEISRIVGFQSKEYIQNRIDSI